MTNRAPAQSRTSNASPQQQSIGGQRGSVSSQSGALSGFSGVQGAANVLQMQRMLGNQATIQMMRQATSGSPPPPASSSAPIQAKSAKLNAFLGAHMRDYTVQSPGPGQPSVYQVKEDSPKGDKIKNKQDIEDLEIDDATGQWRMIQVGQEKGFVRKSKIGYDKMAGLRNGLSAQKPNNASMSGVGANPQKDDEEGALELLGETGETLMTGPQGVLDVYEKKIDLLDGIESAKDEKEALEHKSAVVGLASSPLSLVNPVLEGLIGMKKMIKSANDPDKERDEKGFDITEGAIDTASGATGFIEGVSGVVKDAGKINGAELSKAEAVNGWSGSVGEAIGAIKSTFFAVKDIYDLVQKALSEEGASMDEAVTGGLSAVHNLLEAAKSGVETVMSIYKILKMGTGELSKVIPGLGIAVSGISITIKVYTMIKARISQLQMTEVKRTFKDKYKDKSPGNYVKENDYSIAGLSLWKSTGTDKEKLKARENELRGKQNPTDEEKEELKDIEEYNLARGLKSNNSKILTRGSIQIGLEMANIAGEIATLSGVGAQAGIPLKAAASGVGASMSIFRKVKQYGRDKAAQSASDSLSRKIFNADKSSDKKHAMRIDQSNMILDMIAELPEYSQGDRNVIQQYARVQRYIAATGTDLNELFRLNGDVGKQRELLVKNLAKRE